ncbi:MAG: hypothetical protein ACC660_06465, partial [Acidimicrobiales bacterium]
MFSRLVKVDGTPVVVLVANESGAAFSAVFEGRAVDLEPSATGFTDRVSGVTFDLSGAALDD